MSCIVVYKYTREILNINFNYVFHKYLYKYIVCVSIFLFNTIWRSSISIIYVCIMARSGWHIACNIINLCFKHHYKTRPTSRPIFQLLTILKRIKRRLSVIFPWFLQQRKRMYKEHFTERWNIIFCQTFEQHRFFPVHDILKSNRGMWL